MLTVFLSALTPAVTMLIYIAVGFFLGKKKLLPESSDKTLSQLLTMLLTPATNILTFARYCTVTSLKENTGILLVSTVVCAAAVGVAYALSGFFSRDSYQKNIYRYALAFSNSGYMGIPIVTAILGEQGLYLYLLLCIPMNVVIYTWGLYMLIPQEGGKRFSLKRLLNPCIISVVIGMVLGLTGIGGKLPPILMNILQALSDALGPMAMLLTGLVVAKFELKTMLKKLPVYVAAFFRLILLPSVFVAALLLLKVDSMTIKLCLFAYATPLGLNTVVFPAAYGGDPSTGASMALISHVLCVITIPLLYALVSAVI